MPFPIVNDVCQPLRLEIGTRLEELANHEEFAKDERGMSCTANSTRRAPLPL
jgi:hypothetical protein